MIYLPIIGSVLEAAGSSFEKSLMKRKDINYKNYTVYGFLGIVLVMLPFIFFFWKVDNDARTLKNLLLFFFVIIISSFANLLTYYSLKRKNLSVLEPVRLMQPLLTILLAFIFFSSERKFSLFILAIVASLALIAAHVKKHHFCFDKYMTAALAGSLFFAIELVASKPILEFYNPFTFYFLRCLMIFIITLVIIRPKTIIKNNSKWIILLISIIWVFYRIILYYGYEMYGIVFTTILFILTPVFVYIFAGIFLKEKITLKQIISSIVIVVCVVIAMMIEG
jgi:drug/metabolite transporter (DMT)-like permease